MKGISLKAKFNRLFDGFLTRIDGFVVLALFLGMIFSASVGANSEEDARRLFDPDIFQYTLGDTNFEGKQGNIERVFVNPDCGLSDEPCDGTSWSSGFKTIMKALEVAKQRFDPSKLTIILVKAGTYTSASEGKANQRESSVLDVSDQRNLVVWGGFDGDEDNPAARTRGNVTTLDGLNKTFHVVKADFPQEQQPDSGRNVELRNLVVTKGCADPRRICSEDLRPHKSRGRIPLESLGGGMYVHLSPNEALIMREMSFVKNFSAHAGGGLFVHGGQTKMVECHFTENRSLNGGGFYMEHNSSEISGSRVSKNYSQRNGGGAVFYKSLGLTINNHGEKRTEIAENVAKPLKERMGMGGGISIVKPQGPVYISDAKIISNKARIGGGISIVLDKSREVISPIKISNSLFWVNRARVSGAGLNVQGDLAKTQVEVDKTTFAKNSIRNSEMKRGSGGAVYAREAQLRFVDSVFAWNSANMGGGGAFFSDSKVDFVRGRIEKNQSNDGGGILYSAGLGLSVDGTEISGNGAKGLLRGHQGNGGGVYVLNPKGPVKISGAIMTGNKAKRGGAIAVLEGDPSDGDGSSAKGDAGGAGLDDSITVPKIEMVGCQIESNVAEAAGGGMYFKNVTGEPLIEGVAFTSNQALTVDLAELLTDPARNQGKGGGLFATGTQTRILDSSFTENSAGHGGGAYVEKGGASFEDLVFSENRAFSWGGALKLFDCTGPIFGKKLDLQRNTSFLGTGGIHVAHSELVLSGQSTLDGNVAKKTAGGGISLNRGAKLTLKARALLTLTSNRNEGQTSDGAGSIYGFATKATNIVVLGDKARIIPEGNTPTDFVGIDSLLVQ